MAYLEGEGRANEHTEPHLVAGTSAITAEHGYSVLDRSAALAIAADLDEPRRVFGVDVTRTAVVRPATDAVRQGATVKVPTTTRGRSSRGTERPEQAR